MTIDLNIVNKTISVVAKRNSGKSILIRYLVNQQKHHFSKIFVICPTESINHFYNTITCEDCIFDEWKEDWADQLIDTLTKTNANQPSNERKNVLIILDDCMSDIDFNQIKSLKKIYTRGRHFNLSIITTCQYLNSLPKICRSNRDILISGQMNLCSIEMLSNEYCSNLKKKEFILLFNKTTKDYGFLVINNNSVKDNENLNCIYGQIKTSLKISRNTHGYNICLLRWIAWY